jgi:hypothetical protein
MRPSLQEVKVHIICDPQLVNYQFKIDRISELLRLHIPEDKLIIKGVELESLKADQAPDILILDYDEFSGVRRSLTQLELAYKWAKENPDKLLVIWSRFLSVLSDQKEIQAAWGYPVNIVVKANYDDSEFYEQISQWLTPIAAVL